MQDYEISRIIELENALQEMLDLFDYCVDVYQIDPEDSELQDITAKAWRVLEDDA